MQSHNMIMQNHNTKNTTPHPSNHTNNNNNNKLSNHTNRTSSATVVSHQQQQPARHHTSTTTQACAACKYQRRKCASDCILAPYFPHDAQRQFLNAHRLFGVSNIIKIVRHLDGLAKDHAMRTIIFQSDARAADPIGGCHRIIRDLENRISLAKAELEIVLHHLALCRAAAQQEEGVAPLVEGGGNCYDELAAAVVVDGADSWGCMDGNNTHAGAESTSSSFPHHMSNLSLEECSNDMIKPILEQLGCDDDARDDEFKIDSNGNIIPSNNGVSTDQEKPTFKEEDECFSYVHDHQDLKSATTFFSLTNDI